MRTLQQLANDEGDAYPMAQQALRHQFYMDDVITGHDTMEGARELQKQLYDLLKKGGFILRKWATNEPSILQDVTENQKSQSHVFNFKHDSIMKTLGIGWKTAEDVFCFNWDMPSRDQNKFTKRMLLSDISKLYDPLGWLAPIIIGTKILFQQLWNNNLAWDEQIPSNVATSWEKIRNELKEITNISIPRWINGTNERIELHGFSDASEKAYACVMYTRTINDRGEYVTTLLISKTKVAPLKKKTSVPRLELCGALLLAKLMEKVIPIFSHDQVDVHCWTDSQVVLAWLQGSDKKWEKYIANRVMNITSIVPASRWRYVNTKENPADCATRGLFPSQLLNYQLWWEGPHWLRIESREKKACKTFSTDEGLTFECCATQQSNYDVSGDDIIKQLLERHSSITRATRCLAWVLRFVARIRHKVQACSDEHLINTEISDAATRILKQTQREYFSEDINSLRKNGSPHSRSKLLNLTPHLDENGILQVGGRLQNSNLSDEAKHPAILPHTSRLTELIIDHAHKKTLHGGVRLTLGQTRQRYWIVGGNRAVKGILRYCVRCHRFKTTKSSQIMGNLPQQRVSASRPFTHCGVDFTGHVEVKLNKGRGVKTCKGYVAIFICLATKAVHIELVSDLSTQTFLAALKRLCARRGTPKHMYSDNGTNFKGAAKILHDDFQEYLTITSPEFFNAISEQEIEWHFLCPSWPSAAGIWEAAVKSMKYHLMRVLGEQKLDFEQFTTLLAQIEACLNSRPLCPLTEDVDDLDYLTPGHFVTGTPVMSVPQDNCNEKTIDLRNKWKITELMHQHIWQRWSNEYLHQLQTKSKWLKPKENLSVGDLVILKEDNIPAGKWAMARVTDLHPGADGYVRVVTIQTQNSTLKRPITKLAPLPKRESSNLLDLQAKTETKTQTEENKNKPLKLQKKKLSNYLTLLILSLFTFLSSTMALPQPMFNATQITKTIPMYFDEIGDVQLIHNEWTLLVYYNLTTYWQGNIKVQKYIQNIENMCK
ncbi:uncharacterized protein LOC113228388 [Hyposmocoma kahamanoa]|uniref:uncharacterized protein LOC113228388 n=1 Tax=Hyposmocoma kahamanoa TaxID=1477025 RepID=UPI000E6D82CB|nr:uncharacterized protein LOC113228388 [Hyposmocoma kahamanoa]